jgi:hypothetical protein
MEEFKTAGSGYLAIQQTRPQTIGYGLADSPLLQLAWIVEKFHEWTDLPVDRDQLLTTVSLYWFTGCGASVAHTLYDQAHSSDWGTPPAVLQIVGVEVVMKPRLPVWAILAAGAALAAGPAPAGCRPLIAAPT